MRILIAGSSGLVGSALVPFLRTKGNTVTKLVRKATSLADDELAWDPAGGKLELAQLENFDAVINLAGFSLADTRWNQKVKQEILQSRLQATRLLTDSFAKLKNPPKTFINASAIGYYGNRGDAILDEDSSLGGGFLAEVCKAWELEAQKATQIGCRVVLLRLGIVLALQGGALKKMLPPFKLGLGGKIGDGQQWMSWIALDDLVAAFAIILATPTLQGPINAVAPNPVTNETFTKTLAHTLHRPSFLTVPASLARLAFGEMADEMLLSSTRVFPKKLTQAGYKFTNATLELALAKVIH